MKISRGIRVEGNEQGSGGGRGDDRSGGRGGGEEYEEEGKEGGKMRQRAERGIEIEGKHESVDGEHSGREESGEGN